MKLQEHMVEVYPEFPQTQQFLQDVQREMLPSRDYMYFSEVMNMVEEVGDRYGRWQNSECLTLKNHLVAMEDTGVGGSGRVRGAYGEAQCFAIRNC
jgi:hypothetical protein